MGSIASPRSEAEAAKETVKHTGLTFCLQRRLPRLLADGSVLL